MGWLSSLFGSGKQSHSSTPLTACTEDEIYGTGLWRQHRDRFNRAVDRFYETAVAIHREHPQQAQGFSQLTTELNVLSQQCETVCATLHAQVPVNSLVVPAPIRHQVGTTPEALSRAAGKIAEAAQVAAMFRAQARTLMYSATTTGTKIPAPKILGTKTSARQVSLAHQTELHRFAQAASGSAKNFVAEARNLLTSITVGGRPLI